MRLVETRTVEIGTKLAKAIYNENGKILVNKGVTLQGHTLRRLIQLGITYIYIDDKQTEDIVYQGPHFRTYEKRSHVYDCYDF